MALRVSRIFAQLLVAALVLTMLATDVLASGGGDAHGGEEAHGFPWKAVIYHVINFTLLLGILVMALRKPLKEFLVQRSREVRDALESASKAKAEAEAILAEFKKKLEGADAEGAALVAELTAQGESEKKRLVEQGKQQAERLVAEARRAAEREIERARNELRAEAVRLAADLASERLRKEIGDKEQERYNKAFLGALDRTSS